MWYINGIPVLSGDIHWQRGKGDALDEEEGVKVSFRLPLLSKQYQRGQALKNIERILEQNNIPWITVGHKEWTFDSDKMKKFFPEISSMDWFKGKVSIEPEFETEEHTVFGKPQYHARVAFYIVPQKL